MIPRHTTLLALALATLTACFADSQPPETAEPSTSHIDTCDESADFEASGWIGPGVGEDGALVDPLESYVMGVTAGVPRESEAELVEFGRHNMLITQDLFVRDGFVAANMGGSDTCRTGRTMSLWRDHDAMMQFVVGDAHRDAMVNVSAVLAESKTSHTVWEPDEPGTLPTWDDYHAIVDPLPTTEW